VHTDDLGTPYDGGPPRRVVSLVPSLTEAVAASDALGGPAGGTGLLVGATDWCTHPPDLDVPRVGGTKWPDLTAVRDLRPDLVLANEEENRESDVDALRAAGVAVWVTNPRTLAGAFASLSSMLAACGLDPRPPWWDACRAAWANTVDGTPSSRRAAVPVWRRPWMVLGRDTFAGDVLAHLGVANVFADSPERYPKVPVEEIRAAAPDLVVLPDEPYAFSATDGPEAFAGIACAPVSGRHLTWYGPSLAEARDLLERQLSQTVTA
jgi:ABC-type Fe3+-hydroxamate transport system substrate-binding protein